MSSFANSTVLITGGASGLGKLFARKSLERKAARVILWDINEENLNATIHEFKNFPAEVLGTVIDIAHSEQIQHASSEVIQRFGGIDVLFNNAGVVAGKLFEQHTFRDITKTIEINVIAPMLITNLFLPEMLRNGKGHIINIASAAGLLANPKMSVYAGSKWALLGWSESLRIELEQEHSSKQLHVTTITPSYINTGMFAGVKAPLLVPIIEAEIISEKIMRAVERNKIIVRAPITVYLLPILKGVLPTRLFDLLVGRWLNVYESMSSFVGRPAHIAIPEKQKS